MLSYLGRFRRGIVIATASILAVGIVAGSHIAGLAQQAVRSLTVLMCSSSSACATVTNASTGPAVQGTSSSGLGVVGVTNYPSTSMSNGKAGVYGHDASSSGAYNSGVSGRSPNGVGVSGFSTNGTGMYASSVNGVGLNVLSTNRTGLSASSSVDAVDAESNFGDGVYGFSQNGTGGVFESAGSAYALWTLGDTNSTYLLVSDNLENTNDYFFVDPLGDGVFSGDVYSAGFITPLRSRLGAFASESTRTELDDTGTGQLHNGVAVVRFDDGFARSIDAGSKYQVLLTPDGDCRGLFVAQKSATGFTVRELEYGRSSISFDYRVVAHPAGATTARLPALHFKRPNVRMPRRLER